MTRLLTALPLLILSGAAFGQTFECRDSWAAIFNRDAVVLVVATINIGEKTGTITVSGKTLNAKYYLDGINRRWDWEDYSFLIEPDGDASYFAFNDEETAAPSQEFTCRQKEIEAEELHEKKPETREAEPEAEGISGPTGTNVADSDFVLIVRVAPVYPARALSRGIEGYVDLSFTVTNSGTVRDPVVIFSTSSLLDRAATRTVLKFKYRPRVVDGVPVDVSNVKTRIEFEIED